jgi:ribosomal protein S27E
MEKHSKKETKKEVKRFIETGFYLELECCMCGHKQTVAANTPAQLCNEVVNADWRHLDSDEYGLSGWWDSCDYKD